MATTTHRYLSLASAILRKCEADQLAARYSREQRTPLLRKKAIFLMLLGYLVLLSLIQYKIILSDVFNSQQKLINSLFLWVVSAIWIIIILDQAIFSIPGKRSDYQIRLKKYSFTYN
jgi:hypothetical protein